jgi:hypothetical protein
LKLRSKFWTKMLLFMKFMRCSANILIEQIQNTSCLQIFCESNDSILDIRDKFKSGRCKLIFNNCTFKTSIHESDDAYCCACIILFLVLLKSWKTNQIELYRSRNDWGRQKPQVSSLPKVMRRDIL